ncbi:MAG: sialate O-acetylesterase [Planctomycetia bacterium]|nr:sialate O-acetylesterase [Planctomycetia bacterium]
MLTRLHYFSFALLILTATTSRAEVRTHALISDGMVLQRDQPARLWGTAAVGEKVTVEFRDKTATTVAGSDGKWRIELDAQAGGGPFPLKIVGENVIRFENVFVGDVWLCSGQSNMGWPVATRPGSGELLGTENPRIRLFTVPQRLLDEPVSEVAGSWSECGPTTLLNFSAAAYYFGRELEQTQKVPIGLIHASYGGSGVEQWLGGSAMTEAPELAPLRAARASEKQAAAQARLRIQPEIERYQAALAEAKKNGTPVPKPPRGMHAAPTTSQLYNGMIAPLLPYAIRGVIWYQGEADTNKPQDYEALFSALIRGWRRDWKQGEFPFLFVQIAPFGKIVVGPASSQWAALREAQLKTSHTVERTGMAVVTDWGHETDIHIKQKKPVGHRLALLARALVYGEKLVFSGPTFTALNVKGNEAVLGFEHVGAGLVAKRMILEDVSTDPRTGPGGALHVAEDASDAPVQVQGFTVAGANRKFVAAHAEIRGDTVVVTSSEVAEPVAVRYGWADYPTGNLFNRDGLPASPFRTDDWELSSPAPIGRR